MPKPEITLISLLAVKHGAILATGFVIDDENGCNMTGNGQNLKFVAVKGGVNDWAVYVHLANKSDWYVKDYGDKVNDVVNVLNCVNATPDVIALYRK